MPTGCRTLLDTLICIISDNLQHNCRREVFYFMNEEIKEQRGQVTYSREHRAEVIDISGTLS